MRRLLIAVLPSGFLSLLRRLESLFKRFVLLRVRVAREFRLDRRRYFRSMVRDIYVLPGTLSGVNLEAQLTKDYHAVEKAFALRETRRPYGAGLAQRLAMLVPEARPESAATTYATEALAALHVWNDSGALPQELAPVVGGAIGELPDSEAFFLSRHSIRDFDTYVPTRDELTSAVSLALSTPSVCNRQSWRVRFFGGQARDLVLANQNGNAGFSDSIPVVALVTVDARTFAGTGERNQPWIEGGLFAMTFVWALHSLGLDTCMLNLSLDNSHAKRLRADCGLGDHELPIVAVAIGRARDGARRARSPRRSLDEVVLDWRSVT